MTHYLHALYIKMLIDLRYINGVLSDGLVIIGNLFSIVCRFTLEPSEAGVLKQLPRNTGKNSK